MDQHLTISKQCSSCGCYKTAPVTFRGRLMCQCSSWLVFDGGLSAAVRAFRFNSIDWPPPPGSLPTGFDTARAMANVRDEYAVWAAYDASLARGSEEARRLAALKEIDVLESWWALP